MTTVPIVELDERTKEELQPPCSIVGSVSRRVCDRPAAWVVTVRCHACSRGYGRVLMCHDHASHFIGRRDSWCGSCKASTVYDVVSAEALR